MNNKHYCILWILLDLLLLVGGLEHGFNDFPYIGNVIIPTDELHHFSEELKPPTRLWIINMSVYDEYCWIYDYE